MTISTDFRRKMILKLIEALKESPAFTNLSLDQIKEAVLNSEHQTFQQSKSSDEYLFYINEKLKKIKQSGSSAPDSGSEQMSVETKDEKGKTTPGGATMQAKMPSMYSQESTPTVASVRKMNNFSGGFDNIKRQQESGAPDQNYDSQSQKTLFVKAEYRNSSPGFAPYTSNSFEHKYQAQNNKAIDHDQGRPRFQNGFDYLGKPDHRQPYINSKYQGHEHRPESSNVYQNHNSAMYGNSSQFMVDDSHMSEAFHDKRISYQNSRSMPPHQPMADVGSYKFDGFNTRYNPDMHAMYPGIHQGQYMHDSRSVPMGQKSPYAPKEFFSPDPFIDKKIQNQEKTPVQNQHFIDGSSDMNYKSANFAHASADYKPYNSDMMARGASSGRFASQSTTTPPSLNTFTKKAVSYEYSYPKASVPANNKSFVGNVNPSLYDHAVKKAETESIQSTQRQYNGFDGVSESFASFNRNATYSNSQVAIDPKKSEELFRSFGTEFLKINKNQDAPRGSTPEDATIDKLADKKLSDISSTPKFVSIQEPFSQNLDENTIAETNTVHHPPSELQEYLNQRNIALKQIRNIDNWNTMFETLYNKFKNVSIGKIECTTKSDIETQQQHINFHFLDEEDIQSYLKEIEKIENNEESTFDRTEYLKFIDKAIEAFSEKQNEELCSYNNNEGNVSLK